MPELAPIIRDQRKIDSDHLAMLAIFHFVIAGLSLLGIGFLALHYTLMHSIFTNPEMWKGQHATPPPPELFSIFKWFYLFAGTMIIIAGICNLMSGFFIRQRKYRTFSLVVAGLDCLQVPFGTVLGVFTLIVLIRDSVRETYGNVQLSQ